MRTANNFDHYHLDTPLITAFTLPAERSYAARGFALVKGLEQPQRSSPNFHAAPRSKSVLMHIRRGRLSARQKPQRI